MAPTPFHDLDDYIALPRVEGLSLSPDGSRAVLTVATLNAEKTAYTRALWSIPTTGSGRATRLTRSAKGEAGSAFTASGDVLFVSGRPDAAASDGDDAPQLWLLPAAGGEARAITRLAGGAGGLAAVATEADVVVLSADLLPAAESLEADAALRTKRDGKKVAAILHESYPVRFWDHDIGPDQTHLLALDVSDLQEVAVAAGAPAAPSSASASAASTADSTTTSASVATAARPPAPPARRVGGRSV